MRRMGHILMVAVLSIALLMAGVISGNVLCIGNDGHIAIESPHAVSIAAGVGGQRVPDKEHGPCNDVAVDVEVAVRQTIAGALDAPSVAMPPVFDVALPDSLGGVGGPATVIDHTEVARPADSLGCLRCVVLLI